MEAALLGKGIHEVGFRMAGFGAEQNHGVRDVLGESGDRADSLAGMNNVLSDFKHASSK
ncbi:Uncharacterised protein [Collinsella intestinalis]|nr:Uncharacterised protein [Collinsella intestinalis]